MVKYSMQKIDVDKIISGMSIDEKIGQMFMANICGGESIELAKRNFEEFHFGSLQFSGVFEQFVRGGDYLPCGVCKNVPLTEVADFLAQIKQASINITGIPTILGGDQEGSIESSVFRRRNATIAPGQMGLGANGSLEDTYRSAEITAIEVKALGLDMLYGPSLDVNTNPLNPEIGIRSFGEDPQLVAAHGEQVIKAYARHNIISTAKHFPGRGHGQTNAHHELESIDLPLDRLKAVELLPFARAVMAGVDSIMMSHTLFPALESKRLPASLSPAIAGYLREQMGFEGVIMTDSLCMFAIAKNFEIPRACAMSLEAGIDLIFMKVQGLYEPTIKAIKESIAAGRLTEERIDQSVRRILHLKLEKGLFAPQNSVKDVSLKVGCSEHVTAMEDISNKSVLVMKNDRQLPLNAANNETLFVVVPRDMNVALSNDFELSQDMFPKMLRKHSANVYDTVVDESPTVHQLYEAIGLAKNADKIIFCLYSARISTEQLALLESLVKLGKPVIVVSNSPYLPSSVLDKVHAVICNFGMSPSLFNAAANIIFGKLKPQAQLPVTLNESMPKGFAVTL